jgi:glycosyltransferase involved in cell wall biosynthesis
MVGGGPDLARWQQFVAAHGLSNVELTGSRFGPDLWARLRHAHVALFPMRDNLKNRCRCSSKMFAYAQARRPLIASRVGEIPEILGETPTYVDPTPRAFADAIRQAVAVPHLPDVDYHVERHSYRERGAVYVRELAAAMPELPWDTITV